MIESKMQEFRLEVYRLNRMIAGLEIEEQDSTLRGLRNHWVDLRDKIIYSLH